MNEEPGPFRMVTGSHLEYTTIDKTHEYEQHPRQKFLDVKAGDLVILHHELLHTGTWNTSDQYRYLISNFLCRVGLPHRDPLNLPIIQEIMK
jgi:ectoine hydroxylase-related dioxygenase (phytanoyl-CoA dioxygenase family)